jgi:hypothetical protein
MTSLDHTTATCADGAALMAWIDDITQIVAPCPATRRRIERWRLGMQASLPLVEKLLLDLGLDISQVPAHVWCAYDNGRTGYRSKRTAAA